MTADLSIAALLQAAEYLERRDAEHEYASSLPVTLASNHGLDSPCTKQHAAAALATIYIEQQQRVSPKSIDNNNNNQFPDHATTLATATAEGKLGKLHLNDSQSFKLNQTTNDITTTKTRSTTSSAVRIPNDKRGARGRGRASKANNHLNHLFSRFSVSSCSSCGSQSGTDLQTGTSASSCGSSCPTTNGYLDFNPSSCIDFNELRRCNSSAISLNNQSPQQHMLLAATNHPDYPHHLLIYQPRSQNQSLSDSDDLMGGSSSIGTGSVVGVGSSSSNGSKKTKPQGNRSSHSELEKNRRANLRNCLERLKEVVPLESESARHTTFGLLTRAKNYIEALEASEQEQRKQIAELLARQRYLRSQLEQRGASQQGTTLPRAPPEASTLVEIQQQGQSGPSKSPSFEMSQPSVMNLATSPGSRPSTTSPVSPSSHASSVEADGAEQRSAGDLAALQRQVDDVGPTEMVVDVKQEANLAKVNMIVDSDDVANRKPPKFQALS